MQPYLGLELDLERLEEPLNTPLTLSPKQRPGKTTHQITYKDYIQEYTVGKGDGLRLGCSNAVDETMTYSRYWSYIWAHSRAYLCMCVPHTVVCRGQLFVFIWMSWWVGAPWCPDLSPVSSHIRSGSWHHQPLSEPTGPKGHKQTLIPTLSDFVSVFPQHQGHGDKNPSS